MDNLLIYSLFLTILALVLLGIAVVVLYIRQVKKYNQLRDKKEEDKKEPAVDPQVVMANAQNKSHQILAEASKRAQEIIAGAQTFTAEQEKMVQQEIGKASQMYASTYQEAIKNIENEAGKMMATIPQETQQIISREMTNIRTTMQSQVKSAQDDARQIVLDAYKKAEQEVESYKQQRIKQVDDSIIIILQDIARKVLSKEINKEEHEKLVIKALEEAKRGGIFGGEAEKTQMEQMGTDGTDGGSTGGNSESTKRQQMGTDGTNSNQAEQVEQVENTEQVKSVVQENQVNQASQ